MSPRHFCCTICGWLVLADWNPNSSETWANQFRGLCTGPDGLLLTGVGLYDDPNEGALRAPIDRNMRWSDAGDHESTGIEFGAMTQPAVEDRHGFIFHDACWNLLEKASHPVPVSLERLFEVCKSLPFTPDHIALSWGHDFGGAAIADNVNHFPWEDRYDTREFYKPDPVFSKNPYEASGVDRILAEDPEQPPTLTGTTASPQEPIRDCFASLPQELCTAIAICLPTADVLRARLASRAFWPVFYSQQFWASRFKTSNERSWFFEARECSLRDWRWSYRRTTDARISPGLQNRRRIWELLQGVLDTLALSWNELPFDLPAMWLPDSVLRETNQRTEAIGDFWSDEHPRNFDPHEGCLSCRTQKIAVPDTLRCLSVYTQILGDGSYIVGMSLTTSTGSTIRLGYSSPSEYSVELSEIWGFRIALGSRGVKALQCITGPTSSQSSWLGSPDDTPRTERLVVRNRVAALETAFDGCKMVGIAIHTRSPPSEDILQGGSRLRDLALWYPAIPPRNLCLNEESFLPLDFHLTGYKPLFWCHFGGPGGAYLRHLIGITVTSCLGILRIHFAFDNEKVPSGHWFFGRLKEEEENERVVEFSIDGPGGERIETIEMRQYYAEPHEALPWLVKEGTMVRCELHTNHGRSCRIYDSPKLRRKKMKASIRTKVQSATGTIITGLYATQRPEHAHGITAMGVITEAINENSISI